MKKENNRDEGRRVVRGMLWKWGNYRNKRLELLHDISVAEEQIEAVLDIKAAPLTGMPNGSAVSDKVSRMAELYEEKKARLEEHLKYLREKLQEEERLFETIDSEIKRLPIMEQRVISCRYGSNLTMQQTATRCHYSLGGAEAAERRALERLKKVIYVEQNKNFNWRRHVNRAPYGMKKCLRAIRSKGK